MSHTIEIRKSSRSRAIGWQRLERLARRIVRTILDGEGIVVGEVGVWFVDDPTIYRLCRRYRSVNRPTRAGCACIAETLTGTCALP